MSPLKREQLARFRKKLMEERRAIEARIAAREGDIMDTVREEEGWRLGRRGPVGPVP